MNSFVDYVGKRWICRLLFAFGLQKPWRHRDDRKFALAMASGEEEIFVM